MTSANATSAPAPATPAAPIRPRLAVPNPPQLTLAEALTNALQMARLPSDGAAAHEVGVEPIRQAVRATLATAPAAERYRQLKPALAGSKREAEGWHAKTEELEARKRSCSLLNEQNFVERLVAI